MLSLENDSQIFFSFFLKKAIPWSKTAFFFFKKRKNIALRPLFKLGVSRIKTRLLYYCPISVISKAWRQ